MNKITITEALAALKVLEKRIMNKQTAITPYLVRQDGLRDPLEKGGGSVQAIARERQALRDLETQKVAIRTAIQQINQVTDIEILGQKRTIAQWLTWRKDVAPGQVKFLTTMRQGILTARTNATRQGAGVVEAGKDAKPTDLVINVDEAELAKEHEELDTILATLDGQLSLKNATVLIEIP